MASIVRDCMVVLSFLCLAVVGVKVEVEMMSLLRRMEVGGVVGPARVRGGDM